MTLRTRLALVLVALVVAPLVAAGVLVLYAVPRATADRADSLVLGARSGITDELKQECDRVATATVVTGRSLGTSTPKRATTNAVEDGLADWVSVIDRRGNTVASAGATPEGLVTTPWPECRAGEAGGPAVTSEQQVLLADQKEPSAIHAAQAITTGYLDGLCDRLGFSGDVVLMLDGDIVATTSGTDIDLDERSAAGGVPADRRWCGQRVGNNGRGRASRARDALRCGCCHGDT